MIAEKRVRSVDRSCGGQDVSMGRMERSEACTSRDDLHEMQSGERSGDRTSTCMHCVQSTGNGRKEKGTHPHGKEYRHENRSEVGCREWESWPRDQVHGVLIGSHEECP